MSDDNVKHGTDGKCYLCSEITCSVAGNPSRWPNFFPYRGGNGKWRRYCTKCVIGALDATGQAALATAPPEQARCPDCDEAAKHAYSDATTPGFFHSKCECHRQPQAATVWIVTQDGRVHSVHASRESAEKEQGENLRVDTAPWAVLQDGKRFMQPKAVSAGVLRSDNEYVHAFQLANRVLERINADPDDDLAVLARQFLRANERAIAEHNALAAHDQVTAKAHILNLKELPSKSDEERAEDFMDCNYDSHDDCVKWLAANFADVRRIALAAHDQKVGDQLAKWMIVNSFATGHGDTVEDLLKELKWQIEELRARPAPAASKPEAGHE